MANVTLFSNAITPKNPKITDHEEIIQGIRDGRWKHLIEKLNSFVYDSEEQKKYKRTMLTGVVWQGEFDYRNDENILVHSGLVAIDIDHLPPDELIRYSDLIRKNKYTHVMFISPRRDGLKIIIKIPKDIEHHKEYVEAIGEQYRQHATKYYDHFDDLSRLCFVSYDPDIYYNPDSVVWEKRVAVKKFTPSDEDISGVAADAKSTFNRLVAWAEKTSEYSDGNKHKHLVKLFTACNRAGVLIEDAVKMAWSRYGQSPNTEKVAYRDYQHRADSVYRLYSSEFGTNVFEHRDLAAEFLAPSPSLPIPQPPPITPVQPPKQATASDIPAVAQLSDVKVSFPIEVFPSQLQEFIRQMHLNLNFTPDFTSVAAMFAIATMNGNKYKLRVNEVWVAPTLFWFAAVGDPGTMKSHPISAMIKPIKKIDIDNKNIHNRLMEEYDAAMIDKAVKNKPKKPQFRQIMISDVTLEAIHYVHTVNRRGLGYHKDELIGFINSMNQYKSKGSDEQFWLESFNNQPYMVNRATKETLSIEDTMINIIGTIQPSVLSRISTDNGLTDRFLYTSAEKTIHYMADDKMSPEWFKWWNYVILKCNTMFQYIDSADTVVVEMDSTANEYMKQLDHWLVNMQTSDEHNESLKTYLSKAKTYIPRFALLMAVIDAVICDTPVAVTGNHMERAGHIMSYFIETGKQVFDESARVEEIVGIIKAKTGLTRPELIMQLYKKGISNAEIARQVKVSKANVGQTIKRMTEKQEKTGKN